MQQELYCSRKVTVPGVNKERIGLEGSNTVTTDVEHFLYSTMSPQNCARAKKCFLCNTEIRSKYCLHQAYITKSVHLEY